ncbi:MAG: divalent-cation tolerance protein CutA [Candidatus Omnitrophota bacterium]
MVIIVFVTVPQDKADDLTKKIVNERLCACVNKIEAVTSYFWWENKIDQEKEALLIIKTQKILYNKLKETIEQNHPYSVPEIIAMDASEVNEKYKQWLLTETNPAKGESKIQ